MPRVRVRRARYVPDANGVPRGHEDYFNPGHGQDYNPRQGYDLRQENEHLRNRLDDVEEMVEELRQQLRQREQGRERGRGQPPQRYGHGGGGAAFDQDQQILNYLKSRTHKQLMKISGFGGTGSRAHVLYNGLKGINSLDDLTDIDQVGPKREQTIVNWAKSKLRLD